MKALVLSSGGIDSTTCVGIAVDKHGAANVSTVSFFYGQKHDKELLCAEHIADYYRVKHYVLNLADILKYSDCPLLKASDRKIEHKSYAEQIAENGEGMVETYVPFRNGLMLSSAAALATSIYPGEEVELYIGAHADDAAGRAYADCSPEFTKAISEAIFIGTYEKVKVVGPLLNLNKAGVVKKGLELNVPYDLTWSCYEGGDKACGTCGTCVEENQKVLMWDLTQKSIKDICVGDKIWAVDEKTFKITLTTVLNKVDKGVREVYDMRGLLLTDDHLVYACNRGNHPKFREYGSMKRKDALYMVKSWPLVGMREIVDEESFALGYLRGFVDGDGCIHDRGVFVCQKSEDVLKEFWSLYDKYIEKSGVEIRWDSVREMFIAAGGYSKKFLEKTSFRENEEYCRGYLNGMIIADGCSVYNKANQSFSVIISQSIDANSEKCDRISKSLEIVGIDTVTWEQRCGGFRENGSLMKNWKISKPYRLPFIYGGAKKDDILSKISIYSSGEYLEYKDVNRIGLPVKEAHVYDIETEAHTFFCEGYLIHNCIDRLAAFRANGVEDPIEYETR